MEEQLYFIISYRHAQRGEVCFWRSNNAGYTNDMRQAGQYSESQVKANMPYYHQGENAVAVPVEEIEKELKVHHIVEINYNVKRKHLLRAKLGVLKIKKPKPVPV